MEILTGLGIDIHRFEDGDGFLLAGVPIRADKSIVAHSDGDIIFHSLAQAIFSALGEDDIGSFFPDDSIDTEDMNSLFILKRSLEIMDARGFVLNNVSIALLLERPRLKEYKRAIKESLSSSSGVDEERIAFHVGTFEKIGPFGDGEGLCCLAQVTLRRD